MITRFCIKGTGSGFGKVGVDWSEVVICIYSSISVAAVLFGLFGYFLWSQCNIHWRTDLASKWEWNKGHAVMKFPFFFRIFSEEDGAFVSVEYTLYTVTCSSHKRSCDCAVFRYRWQCDDGSETDRSGSRRSVSSGGRAATCPLQRRLDPADRPPARPDVTPRPRVPSTAALPPRPESHSPTRHGDCACYIVSDPDQWLLCADTTKPSSFAVLFLFPTTLHGSEKLSGHWFRQRSRQSSTGNTPSASLCVFCFFSVWL